MNKERLTTFLDTVLAIVMTILVLELKKPDPVTLAGFWALREYFFAYTLSFFWLGTMWVNLHNSWYKIKRVDGYTVWAILIMLFFSSLFPYATSIVSENFNNRVAQAFYGIIVICITAANFVAYRTVEKVNSDDEEVLHQMNRRNEWLKKDIGVKIVGLILSITVFPPAMMYSVLLTLLFLVIPNQVQFLKNQSKGETGK